MKGWVIVYGWIFGNFTDNSIHSEDSQLGIWLDGELNGQFIGLQTGSIYFGHRWEWWQIQEWTRRTPMLRPRTHFLQPKVSNEKLLRAFAHFQRTKRIVLFSSDFSWRWLGWINRSTAIKQSSTYRRIIFSIGHGHSQIIGKNSYYCIMDCNK